MTVAEINQVAEVVRRVESWPASLRIELARRILETLGEPAPPEPVPPRPRGLSAEEVAALLKMEQLAPDDDECERILVEELSKKYGA
jgi:hypothetical protein